ncbi:MAG: DUF6305 family protein [Clostridia bacterium]|nr:DUF6305 family protein [Clostridia bacterium]
MKSGSKCLSLSLSLVALVLMLAAIALAPAMSAAGAAAIPKASQPVLMVSAGQGNGVLVATALADRIKLPYDYSDVPTAKHVAAGAGLEGFVEGDGAHRELKSGKPKGTPYQTVFLVMGASLKGMGASGLSLNQEVARLKDVIKYCRDKKILLVGMHVEGKAMRGKPGSDNEAIIDAVAPFCDYLIVMNTSNQDGKFTQIGKEKNIPVSVAEKTSEIQTIFQTMFGLAK